MSEGSALEAAELFSQGKFSESAAVWRKLQTSEEADPRIAHNLAVTEFCAGNCRDIDGFFQKLKELSNGVEDSAKHVEKSTKDHIIFNEAAVKFQMKMFGASWALLESLFQGIESVDDDLAYKVCFLLIDIFLFQKQTGKAEEILLELTKLAERFQPSPLSFDEATFGDLLQFYQLKVHLSSRSKETKEVLKAFKLRSPQSPFLAPLRALNSLNKTNYPKTLSLLNQLTHLPTFQDNTEVLYYCNMAVLHNRLHKHNAAVFYATKALRANEMSFDRQGQSLETSSRDLQATILYNSGLALLFGGNAELAFPAFVEASTLYYKNPCLWLRLAECCAAVTSLRLEESGREALPLFRAVLGTGEQRRVQLPIPERPSSSNTLADCSPSYGITCAQNCLVLLAKRQPYDVELMCSAQLLLAFLSLEVNDPVTALAATGDLLKTVKGPVSTTQAYFAHLYAAEALCMLDRLPEALKHLNENLANDLPPYNTPYAGSMVGSAGPGAPFTTRARAMLLTNLAAVHLLKGDPQHLEQAQHCLSQAASLAPPTSRTLLLLVYLELRRGSPATALDLLRRGRYVSQSKRTKK